MDQGCYFRVCRFLIDHRPQFVVVASQLVQDLDGIPGLSCPRF
jgi:hypothetical protein